MEPDFARYAQSLTYLLEESNMIQENIQLVHSHLKQAATSFDSLYIERMKDETQNMLVEHLSTLIFTLDLDSLSPQSRPYPRRILKWAGKLLRNTSDNVLSLPSSLFNLEEISRAISLQLLTSSVLELKREGILILQTLIPKPTPTFSLPLSTIQPTHDDPITTPSQLASFLQSNNILQIIYGPQTHVNLVSQFHPILEFLVTQSDFDITFLATLWNQHCQHRTDENKEVLNTIDRIIPHLSAQQSAQFIASLLDPANQSKTPAPSENPNYPVTYPPHPSVYSGITLLPLPRPEPPIHFPSVITVELTPTIIELLDKIARESTSVPFLISITSFLVSILIGDEASVTLSNQLQQPVFDALLDTLSTFISSCTKHELSTTILSILLKKMDHFQTSDTIFPILALLMTHVNDAPLIPSKIRGFMNTRPTFLPSCLDMIRRIKMAATADSASTLTDLRASCDPTGPQLSHKLFIPFKIQDFNFEPPYSIVNPPSQNTKECQKSDSPLEDSCPFNCLIPNPHHIPITTLRFSSLTFAQIMDSLLQFVTLFFPHSSQPNTFFLQIWDMCVVDALDDAEFQAAVSLLQRKISSTHPFGDTLVWRRILFVEDDEIQKSWKACQNGGTTEKERRELVLPFAPIALPNKLEELFSMVFETAALYQNVAFSQQRLLPLMNYFFHAFIHNGLPPSVLEDTQNTAESIPLAQLSTLRVNPVSQRLMKAVLASFGRATPSALPTTRTHLILSSLSILNDLRHLPSSPTLISRSDAHLLIKAENAAFLLTEFLSTYDASLPPTNRKEIERHGPLTKRFVEVKGVRDNKLVHEKMEMDELDCTQSVKQVLMMKYPIWMKGVKLVDMFDNDVTYVSILLGQYPENSTFNAFFQPSINLRKAPVADNLIFQLSDTSLSDHPAFLLSENWTTITLASRYSPTLRQYCTTLIRNIPSSPNLRKNIALAEKDDLDAMLRGDGEMVLADETNLLYTLQVLDSIMRATHSAVSPRSSNESPVDRPPLASMIAGLDDEDTQRMEDDLSPDVTLFTLSTDLFTDKPIKNRTITVSSPNLEPERNTVSTKHILIDEWRERFSINGGLSHLVSLFVQSVSESMKTHSSERQPSTIQIMLASIIFQFLCDGDSTQLHLGGLSRLLEQMSTADISLPFSKTAMETMLADTPFNMSSDECADQQLPAVITLFVSLFHFLISLGTKQNVQLRHNDEIDLIHPTSPAFSAPFSFLSLTDGQILSFLRPGETEAFIERVESVSRGNFISTRTMVDQANEISEPDWSDTTHQTVFINILTLLARLVSQYPSCLMNTLFSPSLQSYLFFLQVNDYPDNLTHAIQSFLATLKAIPPPNASLPSQPFTHLLNTIALSLLLFLPKLRTSSFLVQELLIELPIILSEQHPIYTLVPDAFIAFREPAESAFRVLALLIAHLSHHVFLDSFTQPDTFASFVLVLIHRWILYLHSLTDTHPQTTALINRITASEPLNLASRLLDLLTTPTNGFNEPKLLHEETRTTALSLLSLSITLSDHMTNGFREHFEKVYSEVISPVFVQEVPVDVSCGFRTMPYSGLSNLGATCYMNSIIQHLFFHKPLRFTIFSTSPEIPLVDESDASKPPPRNVVARRQRENEAVEFWLALQKLFSEMQESRLSFINTNEFTSHFKREGQAVNPHRQEDAMEFLTSVFDRVETVLAMQNQQNAVKRYFYGCYCQKIICDCGHVSTTEQPFNMLSVDVKETSLINALAVSTEAEAIGSGEGGYTCSTCGQKGLAYRRALLKNLPNTLIVHLKRFEHNYDTNEDTKLNDYFEFPIGELDLSQFLQESYDETEAGLDGKSLFNKIKTQMEQKQERIIGNQTKNENALYHLTGVVIHIGTAGKGHYLSLIRDESAPAKTSQWFEFNDRQVKPFPEKSLRDFCFGKDRFDEDVGGGRAGLKRMRIQKDYSAYLLIYQRKTKKDEWENTPDFIIEEEERQKKEKGEVIKQNEEKKAEEEKEMVKDEPAPVRHFSLTQLPTPEEEKHLVPPFLLSNIQESNAYITKHALFNTPHFHSLVSSISAHELNTFPTIPTSLDTSPLAITSIHLQMVLNSSQIPTEQFLSHIALLENFFMSYPNSAHQFLLMMVDELASNRSQLISGTVDDHMIMFDKFMFRSHPDWRQAFLRMCLTSCAVVLETVLGGLVGSKEDNKIAVSSLSLLTEFILLVLEKLPELLQAAGSIIDVINFLTELARLSPPTKLILIHLQFIPRLVDLLPNKNDHWKAKYAARNARSTESLLVDTNKGELTKFIANAGLMCSKIVLNNLAAEWHAMIMDHCEKIVTKHSVFHLPREFFEESMRTWRKQEGQEESDDTPFAVPENGLHPLLLLPTLEQFLPFCRFTRLFPTWIFLSCRNTPICLTLWLSTLLRRMKQSSIAIPIILPIILGVLVSIDDGIQSGSLALTNADLIPTTVTHIIQICGQSQKDKFDVPPFAILAFYLKLSPRLTDAVVSNVVQLLALLKTDTPIDTVESIFFLIRRCVGKCEPNTITSEEDAGQPILLRQSKAYSASLTIGKPLYADFVDCADRHIDTSLFSTNNLPFNDAAAFVVAARGWTVNSSEQPKNEGQRGPIFERQPLVQTQFNRQVTPSNFASLTSLTIPFTPFSPFYSEIFDQWRKSDETKVTVAGHFVSNERLNTVFGQRMYEEHNFEPAFVTVVNSAERLRQSRMMTNKEPVSELKCFNNAGIGDEATHESGQADFPKYLQVVKSAFIPFLASLPQRKNIVLEEKNGLEEFISSHGAFVFFNMLSYFVSERSEPEVSECWTLVVEQLPVLVECLTVARANTKSTGSVITLISLLALFSSLFGRDPTLLSQFGFGEERGETYDGMMFVELESLLEYKPITTIHKSIWVLSLSFLYFFSSNPKAVEEILKYPHFLPLFLKHIIDSSLSTCDCTRHIMQLLIADNPQLMNFFFDRIVKELSSAPVHQHLLPVLFPFLFVSDLPVGLRNYQSNHRAVCKLPTPIEATGQTYLEDLVNRHRTVDEDVRQARAALCTRLFREKQFILLKIMEQSIQLAESETMKEFWDSRSSVCNAWMHLDVILSFFEDVYPSLSTSDKTNLLPTQTFDLMWRDLQAYSSLGMPHPIRIVAHRTILASLKNGYFLRSAMRDLANGLNWSIGMEYSEVGNTKPRDVQQKVSIAPLYSAFSMEQNHNRNELSTADVGLTILVSRVPTPTQATMKQGRAGRFLDGFLVDQSVRIDSYSKDSQPVYPPLRPPPTIPKSVFPARHYPDRKGISFHRSTLLALSNSIIEIIQTIFTKLQERDYIVEMDNSDDHPYKQHKNKHIWGLWKAAASFLTFTNQYPVEQLGYTFPITDMQRLPLSNSETLARALLSSTGIVSSYVARNVFDLLIRLQYPSLHFEIPSELPVDIIHQLAEEGNRHQNYPKIVERTIFHILSDFDRMYNIRKEINESSPTHSVDLRDIKSQTIFTQRVLVLFDEMNQNQPNPHLHEPQIVDTDTLTLYVMEVMIEDLKAAQILLAPKVPIFDDKDTIELIEKVSTMLELWDPVDEDMTIDRRLYLEVQNCLDAIQDDAHLSPSRATDSGSISPLDSTPFGISSPMQSEVNTHTFWGREDSKKPLRSLHSSVPSLRRPPLQGGNTHHEKEGFPEGGKHLETSRMHLMEINGEYQMVEIAGTPLSPATRSVAQTTLEWHPHSPTAQEIQKGDSGFYDQSAGLNTGRLTSNDDLSIWTDTEGFSSLRDHSTLEESKEPPRRSREDIVKNPTRYPTVVRCRSHWSQTGDTEETESPSNSDPCSDASSLKSRSQIHLLSTLPPAQSKSLSLLPPKGKEPNVTDDEDIKFGTWLSPSTSNISLPLFEDMTRSESNRTEAENSVSTPQQPFIIPTLSSNASLPHLVVNRVPISPTVPKTAHVTGFHGVSTFFPLTGISDPTCGSPDLVETVDQKIEEEEKEIVPLNAGRTLTFIPSQIQALSQNKPRNFVDNSSFAPRTLEFVPTTLTKSSVDLIKLTHHQLGPFVSTPTTPHIHHTLNAKNTLSTVLPVTPIPHLPATLEFSPRVSNSQSSPATSRGTSSPATVSFAGSTQSGPTLRLAQTLTPQISSPPAPSSHLSFIPLRTPNDINPSDPFFSFCEVRGQMNELLSTQGGCRFFQECLEAICAQTNENRPSRINPKDLGIPPPSPPTYLAYALELCTIDLAPNLPVLASDRFANYAMQLLVKKASPNLLHRLIACFSPSQLLTLSTHSFGAHTVQAMITQSASHPQLQKMLESAFTGECYSLLGDSVGYHVVYCFLQSWPNSACSFIVTDIISSPMALQAKANHLSLMKEKTKPRGNTKSQLYFFQLQRLVPYLGIEGAARVAISLIPDLQVLSEDSGANYFIQALIKNEWDKLDPSLSSWFFSAFIPLFPTLSSHRIASNVVDCLIANCGQQTISNLVSSLTSSPQVLSFLCQHPIAHYAVQKLCSGSVDETRQSLIDSILSLHDVLQPNPVGQRLLAFCHQLVYFSKFRNSEAK
ncbi:putative Ubiquitin carboxyl-terminal hydrolase 34 [Blattamonas nauphoetae]|uniref:Ubiquitin carboxyl-terminal hydrolase 34 n=1 Tax=Blattamonas nauphoetae TaxID=2049346 RepID=A0ABQ9X701_9EUKA|nr:putative Ubiquitin carboxyl-terminal hydrolase 34 [Blattamonas nauphoetae]